jgi:hypothetical protein
MAALLLAFCAVAAAQERPASYGLISGTVWTPQAHGAPGITVKIRRADDKSNKARWELITDFRGEFHLRVPAEHAEYIVWIELKGHKEPVAQRTVEIEGNEIRDVGLHLPE